MLETLSTNWEIVAKLVFAVVLGGVLGIERTRAGKTAGMRTYALVCLGSALFVLVADLVTAKYIELGMRTFDPLRVASQVVVGIGFLGAGLIIHQRERLSGLTTAAGVWVAAGIGMAVGYGFYTLALLVTVLTFIIFTVLWPLEQFLAGEKGNGNDVPVQ
jgi:putative Mg2+ transporter-C (MgtC) family protein